jgi:hypothetical protein
LGEGSEQIRFLNRKKPHSEEPHFSNSRNFAGIAKYPRVCPDQHPPIRIFLS